MAKNNEGAGTRRQPTLVALAAEGSEPEGTTPTDFSAFIFSEIHRWAGIICKGNIRLE